MNKNKNVQNTPKPNTSSAAAKAARPRRQRRNRRQGSPSGNEPSVSVGVASSRQQRTKNPSITQRTARGVRMVHRELITTVSGSTGFSSLQFSVNPGLALSFPWLAPQAVQWEQYRFNKLEYEYITRAPTTAIGSVLIAPDYDAADQAPNSELVVSTFQDCVEDATWKCITAKLSADSMHPLGPRKFVRSLPVYGSDIKTYDVANLYVCTTGQANGDAIGKLWVSYDVEFFVPQSANATGTPLPVSTAEFFSVADQQLPSATPTAIEFGGLSFNPLGITVTGNSLFRLPRGAWLLSAHVEMNVDNASGSFHIAQDGVQDQNMFDTASSNTAAGVMAFELERLIVTNGLHDFSFVATVTSTNVIECQDHRCNVIISAA